jgi:hypothetical protein
MKSQKPTEILFCVGDRRVGLLAWTALLGLGLPASAVADGSSPFASPLQIADSSNAQQERSLQPPIAAPESRHWTVAFAGLYTHRRGETAGWAPSFEVDYSVDDRLQLHAMAPLAFDRFGSGSTHFGLGDIEIGARYRFIDDDPQSWQPALAFYPLVDFPSGRESTNLGTGSTHAFLPLWLSKTIDQWTLYGGGGYWINPGPLNKTWTFLDVGVIRSLTEKWLLTGDLFYASSSKTSLKEQTGFDVGLRYNITEGQQAALSIGRGLQNASVTNQLTAYLAYILTF